MVTEREDKVKETEVRLAYPTIDDKEWLFRERGFKVRGAAVTGGQTIELDGNEEEGNRAIRVADQSGLIVRSLERVQRCLFNEPLDPYWRIQFVAKPTHIGYVHSKDRK